jgi:hypothetical protein
MVDFGDGFTIESYRIPWLIWIQLLVFVLLIFLLYCFSFLASNHSDRTTASPSASHLVSQETQKGKPSPKNNSTTVVSNCFEISQVWTMDSISILCYICSSMFSLRFHLLLFSVYFKYLINQCQMIFK